MGHLSFYNCSALRGAISKYTMGNERANGGSLNLAHCKTFHSPIRACKAKGRSTVMAWASERILHELYEMSFRTAMWATGGRGRL
jgi:hypothetical protein